MRLGFTRDSIFEIVVWGAPAKGTVGSVMIIEVLEAVDHLVERFDLVGCIVDAIELVSPRTVTPLDGPV